MLDAINAAIKALPEWALEAWLYLALMSPFIIALLYAVCLLVVSAFKKCFRLTGRRRKNYNYNYNYHYNYHCAERRGNGEGKKPAASYARNDFDKYECDELLNDLRDIFSRKK